MSLPSYTTNQRNNKVSITDDQMQQIIISQPVRLQSFHLIKMADAEDQKKQVRGLLHFRFKLTTGVFHMNSRMLEYYEKRCTIDPKV